MTQTFKLQFILSQPIYYDMLPCQANVDGTQSLVFTFSFYIFQVQDCPDKMLQMSWYKHMIFTFYYFIIFYYIE